MLSAFAEGDGRENVADADALRVVRGGSWAYGELGVRATYREGRAPDDAGADLGFRCTRDFDEADADAVER